MWLWLIPVPLYSSGIREAADSIVRHTTDNTDIHSSLYNVQYTVIFAELENSIECHSTEIRFSPPEECQVARCRPSIISCRILFHCSVLSCSKTVGGSSHEVSLVGLVKNSWPSVPHSVDMCIDQSHGSSESTRYRPQTHLPLAPWSSLSCCDRWAMRSEDSSWLTSRTLL